MCITCGCGDYEHRHPHSHSLVWDDIERAAQDAGLSPKATAWNIVRGVNAMTEREETQKVSFSTVVKASDEDRFLLLVVYDPNRMPLRGADQRVDLASPRVLEKACWRFMENGARGGLNHEPGHPEAIRCVENYVYRNPVPWVTDHPDGSQTVVKAGTWLAGFILDEPTWADYKAGKYSGVSMQGDAARIPATAESLARATGDVI